jgi:phage terminase large subunit-like protein
MRFAGWVALFEEELKQFPNGTHDDRVDALSQAIIYLDQAARGATGLKRTLRLLPGGL